MNSFDVRESAIDFDSNAYIQNDFFAKRLRELRLSRVPRLSQKRLAEKLGVTRATLANYETGRIAVPLWFACAAASFFGLPIGELLEIRSERMTSQCEHLTERYENEL